MNELTNNKFNMNHVELCELINKLRTEEGNRKELRSHHLMAKIRKEVETMKTLGLDTETNFCFSEYKDKSGKTNPTFLMNRDGILQIAASESVYVRAKIIEYINALENKLKQRESYMIDDPVERALAWAEEEKERRRLKLENQEVKEENKQLKNEIDEYKDFKKLREILEANVSDMRVGDFSKLLYNNGIKIGRNNLYRWLQVNKYICKVYGHFSPKQQYLDNGYLSYIDEFVDTPHGTQVQYHILITPKGALQIAKKLFEEQFIKNNFKNSNN